MSPAGRPGAPADPSATDGLLRRQLVLAGVAGAVVLLAVLGVGAAVDQSRDAAAATLRPAADGSGVVLVSPAAESSRAATRAAGVALLAVAGVLTLLLDHVYRVARFAVLARPGRALADDAALAAAREDC